ncbi:hypothetical protein ACC705_34470, partial [Rhizobium ruizarguesonis]
WLATIVMVARGHHGPHVFVSFVDIRVDIFFEKSMAGPGNPPAENMRAMMAAGDHNNCRKPLTDPPNEKLSARDGFQRIPAEKTCQ